MSIPVFPPPPAWSGSLFTVGVTGTNGKTSTATLVAAALGKLGQPVLRNTTVGAFLDEELLAITADYEGFLEGMAQCYRRGGRHAVLELTSEALAQGFAKAWPCSLGVFTNLTRDHLDAHGSFEHYLASKAQLFVHLPPGGSAVLNGCDEASALLEEVLPHGVRLVRYGTEGGAQRTLDIAITRIGLSWRGTEFEICGGEAFPSLPRKLFTQLIGEAYAENALAAFAAALRAGVSTEEAAEAIAAARSPSGRFEVIGTGPRAVVDYAHTPDALARTLASARKLCPGTLTVVFGAGGNRDQGKRAAMGESAQVADRVILTSDNPRDEDPGAIAAAIREGVKPGQAVELRLDRAEAIRAALAGAASEDVVVIAGKGHEREQVVGAVRRPFCDQEVARAALALVPRRES